MTVYGFLMSPQLDSEVFFSDVMVFDDNETRENAINEIIEKFRDKNIDVDITPFDEQVLSKKEDNISQQLDIAVNYIEKYIKNKQLNNENIHSDSHQRPQGKEHERETRCSQTPH